jgi:hypothetical protein
LPARWVDLILHLDEQERKTCAHSQHAAPEQSLVAAERAVARQENVLQELMRTDEPTEEAAALLKALRQKVAPALGQRH